MQKIYLVSPNYIRTNSEVGDDVEDKIIFRSILTSQDIDLQRVLGTELYDIVLDEAYQYVTTGTTISERIENILDPYILPIVLYSTLKSVVPFLYFKMSPKTVGVNNSTYQQPVDYQILTLFQKQYDDKYQNYVKRLINFLEVANEDDIYPEWGDLRNDNGEKQNMQPGNGGYFSGMQL